MSTVDRTIQDGIREEIVREVGRNRFRLWFRDTEVKSVDEDAVTLGVPTEVHRTWLQCTYGSTLERAVERVLGGGLRVRLEVSGRQRVKREMRERLPVHPKDWDALIERRRPASSFESFLSEGSDRFPVMLLSQFVHGNGAVDPPAVYVYGDEGCGKTHLLEALRDAVDKHEPGKAVYLTSHRFTTRYVSALRARDLAAVRAFEVDFAHRRLVVLDDVHQLAARKATQHALVRLREKAVGSPTRFVFASRRHPQDLEDFSGRLRSWFMGSVVLKLRNPSRDSLRHLLEARGRAYGLPEVPEAVATWILARTGSVKGAVEVLDRWGAASAELGRPLEEEWLGEIAPSVSVTAREEVVRRAKCAVAEHFALSPSLLDCPTKARRAVMPRRIGIYLVYRATSLPLAEIGRYFGLRSHSSVSRAIREIREAREADPGLEQTIDGLLARM